MTMMIENDDMARACARLRDAINQIDRPQAVLVRKGRTLYIVSDRARELRLVEEVKDE